MSYPLVRELAAEGIPVRLTCRVLGFSTQAFYKWCKQPVSNRDLDDAYLTNELIDAHADDPEFGYRFLADELERAGHQVGERRVWRLCRQQHLWSTTPAKAVTAAASALGRRCTTIWFCGTSLPTPRTPSGSPTSPSIPPATASSTAV